MCIDPILHICTSRGCSSVVERMLCMYEALGSIPSISNSFFIKAKLSKRMYANICLNKRPYALELCFHKYRSLCIIFIWNIRKAICAFDPILSVEAGDIAQWLDVCGPGFDPIVLISNFFQKSKVVEHYSQNTWAKPGFEPGTSCTQSRNHTPRPFGHL